MTEQQGGINSKRSRGADEGAGPSAVSVHGVKWVLLVVCVGQAGVCTSLCLLLGLGPGGRLPIRLGLR